MLIYNEFTEVMKMLIREHYLSRIRGFYHSDLIKILVGIRRCGKSVLMEQIKNELKMIHHVDDEHIISINFEFIEFEELQDYKKLNYYIKERISDEKIYYVFLDEIQNVDNFEKVVNSLRASVKNISIFIAGSNSKMLSDELSSVLSGRYVAFYINPLSYKEYIELIKADAYDIKNFWDYVKWGGLPNRCVFKSETDIKNYLYSVFDSIILRDIVKRLKLQDTLLFDLILQYLIDTAGREFSAENIIRFLNKEYKKISTDTLYSYINALCKALIIRKVYRYDVHGKSILKTLNKFYVTDLGIAQIKYHNSDFKNFLVLENVVYNELLFKEYEVYIGKTNKGEVDFIARKNGETKYIQVAYKMENEDTLEREFSAFDAIKDNHPKYVISLDDRDLSRNGIKNINMIDFLMDDKF